MWFEFLKLRGTSFRSFGMCNFEIRWIWARGPTSKSTIGQNSARTHLVDYRANFHVSKAIFGPYVYSGLIISLVSSDLLGHYKDPQSPNLVWYICRRPLGWFLRYKSHMKTLGSQMYIWLSYGPMGASKGPKGSKSFPGYILETAGNRVFMRLYCTKPKTNESYAKWDLHVVSFGL